MSIALKARAFIKADPRLAREVARQVAPERSNGEVSANAAAGGMTARQRELLMFVNAYIKRYGIAPTFEEMKHGLGLASKGGIHRLIAGLAGRGFLTHAPRRARSIRLVCAP